MVMIRVIDAKTVVSGQEKCYEFAGLHDDTKPVRDDICTGSTFIEVDTGDVYFFDEESSSWLKVGG